jgi:P27 family predicted phage terminase small subunit
MGRPRKPTTLKILEGDRKDRINQDEPPSPSGLGNPPEWFNDLERSAWGRLSERLGEMGVATRADSEAAMLYCSAYATWRKSSIIVAKEGFSVETETTTKAHPLWTVIHEAQRTMLRVLSQFGMTPSARAGLHVEGKPEDDPLMSFLAGKDTGTDGKRRR